MRLDLDNRVVVAWWGGPYLYAYRTSDASMAWVAEIREEDLRREVAKLVNDDCIPMQSHSGISAP